MVSSLVDGTMRVTGKMRVKKRWSILPLSGSCTDGSAATAFAVPGVSKDLCIRSLKTGELMAMTFFDTQR